MKAHTIFGDIINTKTNGRNIPTNILGVLLQFRVEAQLIYAPKVTFLVRTLATNASFKLLQNVKYGL